MFNLEQAIADWRKQMLAAGIKSPVPLEELESHLREEIERQVKSGMNEQRAFEKATGQIGAAESLEAEFKKGGGFWGWSGGDKTAWTNHVLSLLWLSFCSWVFFTITAQLAVIPSVENFRPTPDLFLAILTLVIFLRGGIASIRLFGGNTKDTRIIRLIAVLGVVTVIGQVSASFKNFTTLSVVFALFNIASFWLLRSPKTKEAKTVSK
jgi:hypothetical protein